MLISKYTEIITKLKLVFEFDDKMNKEVNIKTNDVALLKFYYRNNELKTAQGRIKNIIATTEEKLYAFANLKEQYRDMIIEFDCSDYYNQEVYQIHLSKIIDATIITSDPELKGEKGDPAVVDNEYLNSIVSEKIAVIKDELLSELGQSQTLIDLVDSRITEFISNLSNMQPLSKENNNQEEGV